MKKIVFIVEAMGGDMFTYIVDLTNELADSYEIYVANSIRKQPQTILKSILIQEYI